MEKLSTNNVTKINYQRICDEILEKLPSNPKPKILLHVCCGPCSCYPLTFLATRFDITIYYGNSNIYPAEEYDHRLSELRRLLDCLKRDHGYDIKLIVPPYDNENYMKHLEPLKDQPEGGERCFLCYALRMEEAYAYASAHGFDFFTTVMTVSRQKNSQKLNEIGKSLSFKYPNVAYLYSDFKKKKGLEIGTQIRKEYDLYNQDYCGCQYSYEEALIRRAKNAEKEAAPTSVKN
ncbi:MAG: epoxyqueuosine reductase QueH [Bacilli bacterium]|nr:epoxyqueuosine reductase QueH [Bacilli bacterium]